MREVYIENWCENGNSVILKYSDGDIVFVKKSDFNRAFAAIVNATKEAVIRDFAI